MADPLGGAAPDARSQGFAVDMTCGAGQSSNLVFQVDVRSTGTKLICREATFALLDEGVC